MKILFFVSLLIVSLFSKEFWDEKVKHIGSVEFSIKYGDLTPKLSLQSLKKKKNLYALGMLESLKGEIQIFNSKPYISYMKNGQISIDNSFKKSAAFLVYTQVPSWKTFKIPNTIYTKKQLEEFIEKTADEYGIDTYEDFPFLVEGKTEANKYTVRNWHPQDILDSGEEETCASCIASDKSKLPTKVKYIKSSIEKTMLNRDVIMIGFYSPFNRGVVTYTTQYSHINFIAKDKKIAGHTLNMMLGKNMVLKMPKIR